MAPILSFVKTPFLISETLLLFVETLLLFVETRLLFVETLLLLLEMLFLFFKTKKNLRKSRPEELWNDQHHMSTIPSKMMEIGVYRVMEFCCSYISIYAFTGERTTHIK